MSEGAEDVADVGHAANWMRSYSDSTNTTSVGVRARGSVCRRKGSRHRARRHSIVDRMSGEALRIAGRDVLGVSPVSIAMRLSE
jgi:hypothetical protein